MEHHKWLGDAFSDVALVSYLVVLALLQRRSILELKFCFMYTRNMGRNDTRLYHYHVPSVSSFKASSVKIFFFDQPEICVGGES
jgi:hypothetical protein